jgi:hypothetical protein
MGYIEAQRTAAPLPRCVTRGEVIRVSRADNVPRGTQANSRLVPRNRPRPRCSLAFSFALGGKTFVGNELGIGVLFGPTETMPAAPSNAVASTITTGALPGVRRSPLAARDRPPRSYPRRPARAARPSFWQLSTLRKALARGERIHLDCQEDVLVFRKPEPAEQARRQTSGAHARAA